jgi:hypothetical protein
MLAVLCTVAIAVEDAQEGGEWADLAAITAGQDSGNLMQVGEVMGGPGSEKF